jgi:dTDP-4-amino-4,6-dideoxygalactose transaminase
MEAMGQLVKVAAYSVLLRPSLYWIPNGIPQLGLGRTTFTTDFPIEAPTRALTSLALSMLPRLDEFTATRVGNARAFIARLRTIPRLFVMAPRADAAPAYLRLPVLMPDSVTRQRALDALAQAGIGASASYPASLVDVTELRRLFGSSVPHAAGGQSVAQRILKLPTHSFVRADDISRAAAILRSVVDVGCRHSSPAA